MSRKLILSTILILGGLLSAQAQKFSISGSLEANTAYMWRGSRECGPNVAPFLSFNLGGFSLQSYGFIALDGSYKEVDWDLSYKVGAFTFHLADYYFHLASSGTPENYFNFKKGETTHIQEAVICYEPQKLPFTIKWFTFLHGDWRPNADGSLGKPSFASYLEACVYHNFTPNSRLSLTAGASVLKGSFTRYTKNFAVINTELRYSHQFPVGPLMIPLHISYIINPYAKASWLCSGIGIAF